MTVACPDTYIFSGYGELVDVRRIRGRVLKSSEKVDACCTSHSMLEQGVSVDRILIVPAVDHSSCVGLE